MPRRTDLREFTDLPAGECATLAEKIAELQAVLDRFQGQAGKEWSLHAAAAQRKGGACPNSTPA